jgi:hypothetical protein
MLTARTLPLGGCEGVYKAETDIETTPCSTAAFWLYDPNEVGYFIPRWSWDETEPSGLCRHEYVVVIHKALLANLWKSSILRHFSPRFGLRRILFGGR